MIGETVTHYRILDKIGEGGMGVVYRAEDTRLGRQVAIKFLSSRLSDAPLALERFQREARAASALNNPHICSLYDVGEKDGLPFLVMELLDGTTLRRRIDGRPLPLDTAVELGAQIADALDVAHTRGIVHRDIKSANIFVTDRGQAKVLDFGLAKLAQRRGGVADPDSDTALLGGHEQTMTGQTLGTLSSMSPEQARGEELDARTDLFSFGVVLYEMATGREPFGGRGSAVVILNAILNETPPPPSSLNPEVPPALDHIVAKALEKNPDLRYQTAAELRTDLRRLKRETESGNVATRPVSGPARAQVWRSPKAIAAALATVLMLGAGAAWMLTRGAASSAIDSVAVLPFTAAGLAPDMEYLTDGITETLINGLAKLPALRVSARSVVFRYKDGNPDPLQAGRDLNVTAVVTGTVSRRGDDLVVQADLVNVADGAQLWGNRYTRPSADLLALQEDIAGEILNTLRPRLSGEELERAMRRYTDNAQAYQLYLQGRYHWNKGTIEGYQRAIEYFQRAIAEDPNYALAYAGLADSNLLLGSYWVESIAEAKSAAERALAIDPELAEAHVALGHIRLWLDWDWAAAEQAFQRGIALNPASALAHNQFAKYLATLGRVDEAIAEATRAQELDPLSPIVNSDLGWYLLFADRGSEAIEQFRKTVEFDADFVAAHQGLGVAYSEAGRHVEAMASLRRALELSQNSPVVMGHIGVAHARQGNRAAAEATIQDLEALAARRYVPSSALAMIEAALGHRSRALDRLEQAYAEHDYWIAQIGVAPWFKSLRNEARFQQLLAELGLPPTR